MAASAAIRVGAGYATVAVPADLEHIFEIKLTEVMSRGFERRRGGSRSASADAILSAAERAAAVVLGPGLGRDDDSLELARRVARGVQAPLLIDADGLNAHAGRLELIAEREAPTVLTPHAGELGRLLERKSSEIDGHRLAAVREAAERSGAIVVLKGDDTLIAARRSLGDQRRAGAPGWPPPAPATCCRARSARYWPGGWNRSRRSAPGFTPTSGPAASPPSGWALRSRWWRRT